ncbi:uncharacterized protein LOC119964272 [Scyliorhinus canicula]|uniref:uncharacterized protein LOC119964272 n=1 Tax=Scyliorhinus canicula TaxID=7830 RepID=UPI0018F2B903|nr:uncharacterized protein LOC119964272 [Scyliorhinus canicula]
MIISWRELQNIKLWRWFLGINLPKGQIPLRVDNLSRKREKTWLGDLMAHIKSQSNWKPMRAKTQLNKCSSLAHGKRNAKPSSKLKKLSFIKEETDSQLGPTNRLASGAHGSLHLFRMKRTVQRNILKTKKGIEPFRNRSPSLQQWKKFNQSKSKSTTCSECTETTSELSPYLSPSVDSELFVDDDSSTRTDSCSSIELFREAEDHTSVMNQEDIYWFSYKNSTLLDSSEAANIDVIGQPSGLSEILEQTENPATQGSFRSDHVSDGAEVHGNSQTVSFTVAGKTVSKLQASKEATLELKSVHTISLPREQKTLQQIVETSEINGPIQTSTPVETFKQSTRLKPQNEVPICSIILAPVCCRPSKVWHCERAQPWSTVENAPIGSKSWNSLLNITVYLHNMVISS